MTLSDNIIFAVFVGRLFFLLCEYCLAGYDIHMETKSFESNDAPAPKRRGRPPKKKTNDQPAGTEKNYLVEFLKANGVKYSVDESTLWCGEGERKVGFCKEANLSTVAAALTIRGLM